jgi:hypothetical protein
MNMTTLYRESIMQKQAKKQTDVFWVTNLSNRNVSLTDLNLTIKAFCTVNLLDTKHYPYTREQLEKSAASGSLFKKNKMISVRKVAPEVFDMNIPFLYETYIPTRERSILTITEEKYEELNVSDEEFAKENADTAELDQKLQLTKV